MAEVDAVGIPLDRRRVRGNRTRQAILRIAVDVASTDGLEGLTVGRLAAKLKMSKSGLFAHFGSKKDLQLATVEAARAVFIEEVLRPALAAERGLARLWRLSDAWLSYAERKVFRGGCFFVAAAAEFDGRPGRIRDRVAEVMREWVGALTVAVDRAKEVGHLGPEVDAAQLAFEIDALVSGANFAHLLHGDRRAFARARAAIRFRLEALRTPSAPRLPARAGQV